MSRSDDGAPTWADFSERAAVDVVMRSPAAELAALLQRYRCDLDAAARAGAESRDEGMRVLAEQAALVVELERTLGRYEAKLAGASLEHAHRALRILKDRMLEHIAAAGLEVVRLAGMPAAEAIEIVEVECWRHGDEFTDAVVADELEAAIRLDGAVLRPGRVVMGAPLDTEPPPDEPDDPCTIDDKAREESM